MRARLAVVAMLVFVAAPSAADAAAKPYRFQPWMDELFAYPKILDSQYDGAYLEVEYDRPRDLYARDVERGKKVDPKYVSLDTDAVQADLDFDAAGTPVKYYAVGKQEGAKAIVIFLHGLGPGRASGVDDWIHGGNFNRLKNLAMRNDALYLSPSFSDFGAKGTAEMKALLLHTAALSPGAPVFLICGSSGGKICWRLLADAATGPLIGGILFIDAVMNDSFIKTAAVIDPARRVPIHISSSREDRIVGWRSQLKFFKSMKAAVPDYPIHYVLFSAGTHGLSLRMTDWRTTLNWMLDVKEAEIRQ